MPSLQNTDAKGLGKIAEGLASCIPKEAVTVAYTCLQTHVQPAVDPGILALVVRNTESGPKVTGKIINVSRAGVQHSRSLWLTLFGLLYHFLITYLPFRLAPLSSCLHAQQQVLAV